MSDIRLFVAIDLPETIKAQVETLHGGVQGVRWSPREQMHLTLRFIGEVEASRLEAIKDALHSVRFEPFSMALKGVGQFPAQGFPRVLWAGVEAGGALKRLARDVERAVQGIGIAPDRKPFSPHLTLTRFKYPPAAGELKRFYERNKRFATPEFTVDAFKLFSSVLSSQGAKYSIEAVFAARGGGSTPKLEGESKG